MEVGRPSRYLLYWDAESLDERIAMVATAQDVKELAEKLLVEYRRLRPYYPGMELRFERGEPENSMTIAVAQFGMALFVADENIDQRCSVGDYTESGAHPEVYWDQPTQISFRHFVSCDKAMECIEEWLMRQTLSEVIEWSDDCA